MCVEGGWYGDEGVCVYEGADMEIRVCVLRGRGWYGDECVC